MEADEGGTDARNRCGTDGRSLATAAPDVADARRLAALRAYQNELAAQSGKALTAAQASTLTNLANALRM